MKLRFSTYDLICCVTELQKYVGLRVNQVYDIDNKTYLIRLQRTEEKVMLLLESGNKIHTTDFQWPKNPAPSGFSMKMRKHIKNKRLESVRQLGVDRIVDLQFGSGEAAYHVFLELFDKGNIMLTDHELTILYVLRPHTQGDQYVFAVQEKYPVERARLKSNVLNKEELSAVLLGAKNGASLRKILTPLFEYGPALIDHALIGGGFTGSSKVGIDVIAERDTDKLMSCLAEAEAITQNALHQPSKGYIIQKVEKRPLPNGNEEEMLVNVEFHPMLFRQHANSPHQAFETFHKCVDVYYSSLESQKIDLKVVQKERDAIKKLENVRRDHDQRLEQLEHSKETDKAKAELITKNKDLVEEAILGVRTMLANQMSWPEIQAMVKEAGSQGDRAAAVIKAFKLQLNQIVLQLQDPYTGSESDDEKTLKSNESVMVDIDLDLSAFANARRYYDQKRSAAKKQQKTLESQGKAFKSAEKKTKQSLKEMKTIVNITKARKVFWFEKFYWFITSENYLVIGGRDATQNELIVKRYMRAGDVYVHADVHGASSVVVKNPTAQPIPPKSLNEAGVMAISYSVAWEAKVVTVAWWVNAEQVVKSAPAGEYLPTGSFSIRGKKNYLPQTNLIMGFSFLFKLEESSVSRHADERAIGTAEDEVSGQLLGSDALETVIEDVEVILSEGEEVDDKPNEAEDQSGSSSENDEREPNEEECLADGASDIDTDDSETRNDEGQETHSNAPAQQDALADFPNTEIKITHSGKKMSIETKSTNPGHQLIDGESVVYLGDEKPVILNSRNSREKKARPPKAVKEGKEVKFEAVQKTEDSQLKRGQRFKLKKIKGKYKDQDEEDLQLRLEFLQAAGTKKMNSKKNKRKEALKLAAEKKEKIQKMPLKMKIKEKGSENEEEEEEEVEVPAAATDLAVVDTLTALPHPDDELLFAVPVIAPYTTLQNYKFKVKLTPGTGKRGKAARTALEIFLKDKTITQREKELLKGVKDEDLARNLPGKVKLSAPQLHKK